MNAIWETLTHTPWWVYLLLIYLLKIGIDATKAKVVPLKKLIILPAIFLILSLNNLITGVRHDVITLGTYLISLLFGAWVGWLLVRKLALQFDKKKGLIRLPGSWVTLVLIVIIFSTKYYFGYTLASDPTKAQDTIFEINTPEYALFFLYHLPEWAIFSFSKLGQLYGAAHHFDPKNLTHSCSAKEKIVHTPGYYSERFFGMYRAVNWSPILLHIQKE